MHNEWLIGRDRGVDKKLRIFIATNLQQYETCRRCCCYTLECFNVNLEI